MPVKEVLVFEIKGKTYDEAAIVNMLNTVRQFKTTITKLEKEVANLKQDKMTLQRQTNVTMNKADSFDRLRASILEMMDEDWRE